MLVATLQLKGGLSHITYVGLTEGTFKTRFDNHTSTFRNQQRKHATELSKYIWTLKDSDVRYSVKWKIIERCRPYSNKTKKCNLCLYEKCIIIFHPELCSLNTRNELISTCRQRKHTYYVTNNRSDFNIVIIRYSAKLNRILSK